jgi:hypothetical protein
VRGDGGVQKGVVTLEGGAHRVGMAVPTRGAALDVGKEEGDDPGG